VGIAEAARDRPSGATVGAVTGTFRAAAAAVVTLGLILPAASAQAGATDWSTVMKLHRAKLQVCKQPTTKQGPWKIKVRVDARRATTPVRGSAEVDKGDLVVSGPWKSHWIQPGAVSKVRTLRMPRGSAFTLQLGLETDTAGAASAGPLTGISRC
jgi:hypothetical protein